ncbi:hypothetical protein AGLY_010663 [Aphis glycines]|uniref:Uncharacterized protein n=1 Tax=Aphis glycines TaxID=307491 RepID=A0A6G0TGE0_APHGL|nr:hypothetical protein AGLY_010663 [Aphis glycines]
MSDILTAVSYRVKLSRYFEVVGDTIKGKRCRNPEGRHFMNNKWKRKGLVGLSVVERLVRSKVSGHFIKKSSRFYTLTVTLYTQNRAIDNDLAKYRSVCTTRIRFCRKNSRSQLQVSTYNVLCPSDYLKLKYLNLNLNEIFLSHFNLWTKDNNFMITILEHGVRRSCWQEGAQF